MKLQHCLLCLVILAQIILARKERTIESKSLNLKEPNDRNGKCKFLKSDAYKYSK